MKRKNVALRIVNFLREHDGFGEINQVKFAKEIECHHSAVFQALRSLNEKNTISRKNNNCSVYFLNERFISVAEHVTQYLCKYPDGALIDYSEFSRTRNVKQPMLVFTLQNLCDIGVIEIVPSDGVSRFNTVKYKILEQNDAIWRSLFEPKEGFQKQKEVFESETKENDIVQSNTDHTACEIKYNQALRDKNAAQDLAIRFGEETQKAKTELLIVKEHNKALQSANDELREKLHVKEQEIKFVRNDTQTLEETGKGKEQRLSELQKAVFV